MGWLPWSSAKQGPTPSSDGGFIAPDRSERAQCWEARDAYYKCLDKADIIDPITNAKLATQKCPSEEKGFEQNCASSWVKYFKQKRLSDWKKEQVIKQIEAEGGEVPSRSQSSTVGGR